MTFIFLFQLYSKKAGKRLRTLSRALLTLHMPKTMESALKMVPKIQGDPTPTPQQQGSHR